MKLRFIISICISLIAGCGSNDHIHSEISPNGEKIAIAFFRNSIADHETHVSIIDAKKGIEYGSGNVVILEGNIPVWVEWKSDSILALHIERKTKEIRKEDSFNGVSIQYEGGI